MNNGVYFGMPFDEYQAIERLSKTGIKRMLISPADYWLESHLNPDPPRLTPEQEKRKRMARLLGGAYHCARLEPDEFETRYVREISQADFADQDGFLGTGAAIEAQLAERGEPKRHKDDAGVLSQARRLKAAGYEGPIWHILEAEFLAEKGDRIALPGEAYDQIVIDMQRIARVPEAHDALSNGYPEVSILYDCPDTGLPMKARLDWLRGDGWVEFKSFANPNGKPVDQCLIDAIRFNRYYVDLAAYDEAVEAIRSGAISMIHGEFTEGEASVVAQIAQAERPLPNLIVFQQKGGVPNILTRSLQLYENPMEVVEELQRDLATQERIDRATRFAEMRTLRPTMIGAKGRADIRKAKRAYLGYGEIYPRGEPWLPYQPHADLGDLSFNSYWLEER